MKTEGSFGSDLVVDLMKLYDIEYAAINPGASYRGIQESIVNYGGNKSPEIITCCHESIAVGIAHGYALAKKKPMAAICHDVVGLQHASLAINNAWNCRTPVMILGGTGPMDAKKRRPWIDWLHTALVQGNAVRDYVKWDDQPASIEAFPESFARAYKLCMTKPHGPVYLCYDSDLQERAIEQEIPLPDKERLAPPTPIQAPGAAIEEAANLLVSARNPVIIADRMGYAPEARASLVQLAELLCVPVIDTDGAFNFPNDHPLDLTGCGDALLREADLVLGLEVYDMAMQIMEVNKKTGLPEYKIPESAKLINVTLEDLMVSKWLCDYGPLLPLDMAVCADTDVFLPALLAACKRLVQNDPAKAERAERAQKLAGIKEKAKAEWLATKDKAWDSTPISPARIAAELWAVVKGRDWTLINKTLGGLGNWTRRLWEWKEPEQIMRTAGDAGLGVGLAYAAGVALAYRGTDRLCVNLQTDGDLNFIPATLWTLAHHNIPLLTVMDNNRAYNNSLRHAQTIAKKRNRSEETIGIGTRFTNPEIDYAQLANSYGVMGIGPIKDPGELRGAFEKAVGHIVTNKAPVLVDIHT